MPDLATRTARKKLEARDRPYWQKIARGRALGYTTAANGRPGRWKVRARAADTSSGYRFGTLGAADDLAHQEADGDEVLTYAQALAAAGEWDPYDPDPGDGAGDEPAEFEDGATVADVMEAYLAWADENTKSGESMRYEYQAHIKPELGEIPVDRLTKRRLRRWHRALADKPARVRSAKGKKQRTRKAKTADEKRARKATANRILTILKAGLHRQWIGQGMVRGPWSDVKPFSQKKVRKSRARHLKKDELTRLLNAMDEPEFRDLVQAALLTGMRYGELCRLRVEDVHLNGDPSVVVRESKADESRAVFLSDEGAALFERLTAGKAASDRVLTKAGGEPWGKSQQGDRMQDASEKAKIDPPVTFHQLRHHYASSYLMAGGNPTDLAEQLGHADTKMIERHYKHLADRWRAKQAQRFVPEVGVDTGNVRQHRPQEATEAS